MHLQPSAELFGLSKQPAPALAQNRTTSIVRGMDNSIVREEETTSEASFCAVILRDLFSPDELYLNTEFAVRLLALSIEQQCYARIRTW